MKKNGFVMIETIIVISVLSIGLITLYGSYSLILQRTSTKATYDTPEFLYKTYYIREYFKRIGTTIDTGAGTYKKIYQSPDYCNVSNEDFDETACAASDDVLLNFGTEKVYLIKMNISTDNLNKLDGNTINYVRTLKKYSGKTIIAVKYVNTLNAGVKSYSFAALEY